MTTFTRLLAASVCLLTFNLSAGASSIEIVGDTAVAEQASIIRLGKPLDCSVDVCPAKVEETVAAPTSGALVDAFGMPTKMPTILRGGQSSDETLIFSKGVQPTVVPAEAQPETAQQSDPQPATVVEPQGAPEDAVPAPANIEVN